MLTHLQLRPPVDTETEERFVLVRTSSGTEGYVQVRYVVPVSASSSEGPVLAAVNPKPITVQATSSPDKCADVMVDIAAALKCLMFALQGSLW
jgi:hypothetical protein